MATKHTYLKTHTLAGTVLTPDVDAESQKLRQKADAATSGRAAKTLVKEGQMRATLVALKRNATLDAHAVDGVVSVQALRGKAALTAGGREATIAPGNLVVIGEGVQHSLRAQADSVLLITVAMSR